MITVNGKPSDLVDGVTVRGLLEQLEVPAEGRVSTIASNNSANDVNDATTVAELLARLEVPSQARGVAVAVDAEVVPRGQWGAHELQEGARVEILRAIQGG